MQSLPSLSEQKQRLVLSPTTDNSLNVASNTTTRAATSRKRKSSDFEDDSNEIQPDSFTAKLLSNKGSITFASVTLVARACLPLAWLTTSSVSSSLVFQAAIPTVEEWEQRALIVRKVPNGGLYAIERVATDAFVACALQGWVSETWCHDAAIGKIADVKVEDLLPTEGDAVQRSHSRTASGSSSTALPTPKSPKRPKNRRGALARMSILALKDPMDNLAMTGDAGSPLLTQPETDSIGSEIAIDVSSPTLLLQPSIPQQLVQEPDQITPGVQNGSQNAFVVANGTNETGTMDYQPLAVPVSDTTVPSVTADTNPLAADRLRTQYFEHLYTSKTSLAFYVKGPLARARAHVRTADNASKTIQELTEFYVESVLPTKKVDLKYKESLSKVVKELPVQQQEDGADAPVSKKKKPRKKKMKLGKDGLWPEEEDFIAKWWRGREIKGTVSGKDQADEMRKELADLRMRETKMQLLLILEVMLLETAASKLAESEMPAIPADPKIKVESVEQDSTAALLATTPRKQPKKEKKRDWSAELDTIVDRLCIWHTVSLDDLLNPSDNKSSKKDANGSTASKPNDTLRDFCKDVLLPFYSAKLPVQVKAVCRKLGGLEVSPKRPQPARPALGLHRSSSSMSSFLKAKPGQPLTTRTLERVLSEDHQLLRHASPPTTFSRASSISAPIIPTLKREPSERPISRGGMLSKSVSFSNREIDLVADQKVHDAKRRKIDRLAQQKKELEAAIDALKKPDRKAVASQIMDEAEERKRLEREKLAVQISATPKAKRVKGQSQVEEPELPPMPMPRLVSRDQDAPMVIPSSTMKPRPKSGLSSSASAPRSSAMKRAVLAAIHETPSRGLRRKTSNPLDLSRLPRPPSEAAEPNTITATPAPRHSRHGMEVLHSPETNLSSSQPRQPSSQITDAGEGLLMKRSRRPVLFTPLKKSDVRLDQVFRDAPEIPEQAGRMMDRVMGGKGRGIDEGFEPLQSDHSVMSKKSRGAGLNSVDVEDGDIYDKLGWNDDFDL